MSTITMAHIEIIAELISCVTYVILEDINLVSIRSQLNDDLKLLNWIGLIYIELFILFFLGYV